MTPISRRRREARHKLTAPMVVQVLLRSLRRGTARGVEGILTDVSKNGMGVVVQEHVALETRCYVEIPAGNKIRRFKGEVCYVQRSAGGIKLGIMLAPGSPVSVLEFLENQGINLNHKRIG